MDPVRTFLKDVKRIVIKVGTAVVTRGDGRVALGRLGALCEQIKELIEQDYEVVLVTSGAVGLGRQRLRYRKLSTSSFLDLQKPLDEPDGKACAAVGQNCLMALYDTLFTQLDLEASQILMTDSAFMNKDFRNQLTETVKSLLSAKVIPIFNENDAISTIKDPYEDSSGIFWDNDSLAALLAMELEADLLLLLSDVNGLYSCPPSDPNSRLIHTYIPEKHQSEITFGDKSRLGRGGMTAKVNSAVKASKAGIPVIITSGSAPNSILKVVQGERVGTLFHMDAHLWENEAVEEVCAMDNAIAKDSPKPSQALSSDDKKKILLDIADALEAANKEEFIHHENGAKEENGEYEKSLNARIADSVRLLVKIMEDPNWMCSGNSIGKREEEEEGRKITCFT